VQFFGPPCKYPPAIKESNGRDWRFSSSVDAIVGKAHDGRDTQTLLMTFPNQCFHKSLDVDIVVRRRTAVTDRRRRRITRDRHTELNDSVKVALYLERAGLMDAVCRRQVRCLASGGRDRDIGGGGGIRDEYR